MIFDKIDNIDRYLPLLNDFKKYYKETAFNKGRIEIDSDYIFAIGLEYETKSEEICLWEAHRKYLDIHLILEGEEIVNICDISTMKSEKDYEEDYELFSGEKTQSLILKSGDFLLLYPNEVHKTSIITPIGASKIKKLVFKQKI